MRAQYQPALLNRNRNMFIKETACSKDKRRSIVAVSDKTQLQYIQIRESPLNSPCTLPLKEGNPYQETLLDIIYVQSDLKRQCHEIFCLWFFS